MKFLTFTLKNSNKDRFGFVFEDKIIDINKCAEWIKDIKNNVSFNYGVASGDPSKSNVIIWTKVTPSLNRDIKINNQTISDEKFKISNKLLEKNNFIKLSIGKKKHYKIVS